MQNKAFRNWTKLSNFPHAHWPAEILKSYCLLGKKYVKHSKLNTHWPYYLRFPHKFIKVLLIINTEKNLRNLSKLYSQMPIHSDEKGEVICPIWHN